MTEPKTRKPDLLDLALFALLCAAIVIALIEFADVFLSVSGIGGS